ncbi:MAG: barnase inhibitor [Umezawaea sp.]
MTSRDGDLPVLIIDGARFSDVDGFAREFSRLLCHYAWRGNLDAFNDLLRGGFGTPENGWILRWLNSQLSRSALGYQATIRWLERNLLTCHPSHRSTVESRIDRARHGEGPTLFDEIVDIIRDHGPGGDESEDGIHLQLL